MSLIPKGLYTRNIIEIDPDLQCWPRHSSSTTGLSLPEKIEDGELIGVDLEYHRETKIPYMASIGIANYTPVSNTFARLEFELKEIFNGGAVMVGHNILNADIDSLNITWRQRPDTMPVGGIIDTLLAYYLMNQHLCHGNVEKDEETNSPEYQRGPGRLRLGSMTSQYLSWAEYKRCRGRNCKGPCPEHNEAWYNALDALGPVLCWLSMLEEAASLTTKDFPQGVPIEKTHNHAVKLQLALNKMQRRGIPIDPAHIEKFDEELSITKMQMFPFVEEPKYGKTGNMLKATNTVFRDGVNPNSPKDVKRWARENDVMLESFTPDDLKAALQEFKGKKGKIGRISYNYVISVLERLIEFKKLGRGVKSWFDPKYIHSDDDGHKLKPQWSVHGGSMGRPVSKTPNVQNLPKRGHLSSLRKAIRAPQGFKYLKADAKQGEFRIMLHVGGTDPMSLVGDPFTDIVNDSNGLFEEVSKVTPVEYLKKPRNGAKQMVHACNYGEGMRLINQDSLYRGRAGKEINDGVLEVFEDWIYAGKYVVGYDGSNLTQRLYGNAKYENRRKVLVEQMRYFKRFPAIKRAQQKIMAEAQNGFVITPSGHMLKLYGDHRDNIKKALAMYGQCTLSVYMQETIINYSSRPYPPVMYVHDEIGFLVPVEWTKEECLEYVADMSHKSKLIPGFQCPIDAEWGPSYGELEAIE